MAVKVAAVFVPRTRFLGGINVSKREMVCFTLIISLNEGKCILKSDDLVLSVDGRCLAAGDQTKPRESRSVNETTYNPTFVTGPYRTALIQTSLI